MATNQGIKQLRFYKFPLAIAMLIGVVMVVRVPLVAMTTAPAENKAKRKVANRLNRNGNVGSRADRRAAQNAANANATATSNANNLAGTTPSPESPAVTTDPGETASIDDASAALEAHATLLNEFNDMLPRLASSAGNALKAPIDAANHSPTQPAGNAVITPEVNPNAGASEPDTYTEIVLRNPSNSGGRIQFLIGSDSNTLEPGDELRLPTGEAYRLRFHRGAAFGTADKTLTKAGLFQFVPTRQGWQLK